MLDWMRMIYRRMRYLVTSGGTRATRLLASNVGVLAGDSFSPALFNFYVGDILLADREDDVLLDGVRVKNLEQADDGTLVSCDVGNLQRRLTEYEHWAGSKGLRINVPKTHGIVFGRRCGPALEPLKIYDRDVQWTDEATSLGILFCTTRGDVLDKHHLSQAAKAARAAGAILSLQRHLGDLAPKAAIQLYQARIEPLLSYGCEVGVALTADAVDALTKVQINFFRRILGYTKRSMRAIVFSETGVLPILHRRLILALRFYKRMLMDLSGSLASRAFCDARALYVDGQKGWIGDIVVGLTRLAPPVLVDFRRVVTGDHVDALMTRVEDSFQAQVRRDTSGTTAPRRTALMRERVEVDKRGCTRPDAAQYRSYLDIAMPHHRKALTRLITGDHELLGVRGAWAIRGKYIAYEWRLCRLCAASVEDAVHALFTCIGRPQLAALRHAFWDDIGAADDTIRATSPDPAAWIRVLAANPGTQARLGKFAFDVLHLFSLHRAYIPPQHAWRMSSERS
ncbi:hypothetical protein BD626DRAFT_463973 [Schizophyllum amplum]|uniref:Reverse transcriptase domain-containing protein n=1 Tax=Schizophyllum amplum TaxID=97359 RepID=A0A550C0J5_9AGAR|nr:hypothetical protein BD626DRAFT_463973 [Auriculariopsis ampla]